MDYEEYKGFKFSKLPGGRWALTFPSGVRTVVAADNADAIKARIDELSPPEGDP